MKDLNDKAESAERLYSQNGTVKRSVMAALRLWQRYVLTEDESAIAKAYHVVVTAFNTNSASLVLAFIIVFLELELQNYEKADELLDSLGQYRNYYKNNEPRNYAILICLQGMLSAYVGKSRATRKSLRILNDLAQDEQEPHYKLMISLLENAAGEHEEAYRYLAEAYRGGCRSFFLYTNLYRLLMQRPLVVDAYGLFLPLLKWVSAQGVVAPAPVEYYQSSLEAALILSPESAGKIYGVYKQNWILEIICRHHMQRLDYSHVAYRYYREAELKQVDVQGLAVHLVRGAYVNREEDISRYMMEQFLRVKEKDEKLKVFAYHLLLTNKKLRDLAPPIQNEITQFSLEMLDNGMKGRYYNSLYKNLLEIGVGEPIKERCREMLEEQLFCYKAYVPNPSISRVWVLEKEKKERSIFFVEEKTVTIRAVNDSFTYVCFDSGDKNMIDIKLDFIKQIEDAGFALYSYFYSRGYSSSDLLLALAKCYISGVGKQEDCVAVLNATLSLKNISRNFRMLLSATLGNILAAQNRFDKAMEYYTAVDENYLSDDYIEQMLSVFINAGDYEKAVRLIIKKPHCISDRNLFFALKKLAGKEEYRRSIADVTYELLLKSWYDKNLIDLVIANYSGGQSEWQELGNVLSSIQASEMALDEIILRNSIWMHLFDKGTQKVFARMYEMNPLNGLIHDYVYYLSYEMIINDAKPEYETIEILERIAKEEGDGLLILALCHLYCERGIDTFNSDGIIETAVEYMEEEDILLPSVARRKDKSTSTAYILKNQPFIYRSVPGKTVYVYYTVDGDEKIYTKKMKYLRFGLYTAVIPQFYGETLCYYFCEELDTGSLATKTAETQNMKLQVMEVNGDEFFSTNNALIYEHMFKYEHVESIITEAMAHTRGIKGVIL